MFLAFYDSLPRGILGVNGCSQRGWIPLLRAGDPEPPTFTRLPQQLTTCFYSPPSPCLLLLRASLPFISIFKENTQSIVSQAGISLRFSLHSLSIGSRAGSCTELMLCPACSGTTQTILKGKGRAEDVAAPMQAAESPASQLLLTPRFYHQEQNQEPWEGLGCWDFFHEPKQLLCDCKGFGTQQALSRLPCMGCCLFQDVSNQAGMPGLAPIKHGGCKERTPQSSECGRAGFAPLLVGHLENQVKNPNF